MLTTRTLETLFKGYIYDRVDFSGFVNNMETSLRYRILYTQIDTRRAWGASLIWPKWAVGTSYMIIIMYLNIPIIIVLYTAPYIPLINTMYSYTSPYTPKQHHTPLYTPIQHHTPPYTLIHHPIPLYNTIYPYTTPYTPIYPYTTPYTPIHSHTPPIHHHIPLYNTIHNHTLLHITLHP